MAWKYINPGYGTLFDPYVNTHQSYEYNPQNGVYITANKTIRLPIGEDTSELWVKFNLFIKDYQYASASFGLDLGVRELIYIQMIESTFRVRTLEETDYLNGEETNLKEGLNTVWIYLNAQSTWAVTVVINGKTVFDEELGSNSKSPEKYSGALTYGTPVNVNFTNDTFALSNIIISNSEIDQKEIIVKANHSAVETDMAASDTAYLAISAGQYCLQVLDTSSLRATFGADGKITGMVAIAAPAYTTEDANIRYLKCRKVVGGQSVDYTPEDPADPGEDWLLTWNDELEDYGDDYIPAVAMQLPVDSGTTISSINGAKIGWVTV